MEWYYHDGTNQHGPFDEAAFDALVASGRVRPETPVWNPGLPQWTTWAQARASSAGPAYGPGGAAPGAASGSGGAGSAASGPMGLGGYGADGLGAVAAGTDLGWSGRRACVECGGIFPEAELINYGGHHVCASCKPFFFQKLREGVAVGATLDYAGFWVRFGAKFVDGLLLFVAQMGVNLATTGAGPGLTPTPGQPPTQADITLAMAGLILNLLVQLGYQVFFLGKYGATPGKMLLGLRVVTPEGEPITYMRALGRWAAEIVTGCTFLIGYIIAAFDEEKRSLHDRIAGTRVVRK